MLPALIDERGDYADFGIIEPPADGQNSWGCKIGGGRRRIELAVKPELDRVC